MSDYVFAFHFLCWNQGPFLSQYHTFWERLGQLWCLESRAQGHPVIRNHGETNCYRQLASCFGRVAPVGDIHVSITRNVADPESCWNHWCEAIAKPCAIEIGQLFWPNDSHWRRSCSKQSLICCVSTWWIFNAIEKLALQVRTMIIPLLSNLQHSEPADHVWLCFCLPLFVLKSGPLSITVSHFLGEARPAVMSRV